MTSTTSITKMLIRTTHESKIISCQFIFVSSGRGECYYLLIHMSLVGHIVRDGFCVSYVFST